MLGGYIFGRSTVMSDRITIDEDFTLNVVEDEEKYNPVKEEVISLFEFNHEEQRSTVSTDYFLKEEKISIEEMDLTEVKRELEQSNNDALTSEEIKEEMTPDVEVIPNSASEPLELNNNLCKNFCDKKVQSSVICNDKVDISERTTRAVKTTSHSEEAKNAVVSSNDKKIERKIPPEGADNKPPGGHSNSSTTNLISRKGRNNDNEKKKQSKGSSEDVNKKPPEGVSNAQLFREPNRFSPGPNPKKQRLSIPEIPTSGSKTNKERRSSFCSSKDSKQIEEQSEADFQLFYLKKDKKSIKKDLPLGNVKKKMQEKILKELENQQKDTETKQLKSKLDFDSVYENLLSKLSKNNPLEKKIRKSLPTEKLKKTWAAKEDQNRSQLLENQLNSSETLEDILPQVPIKIQNARKTTPNKPGRKRNSVKKPETETKQSKNQSNFDNPLKNFIPEVPPEQQATSIKRSFQNEDSNLSISSSSSSELENLDLLRNPKRKPSTEVCTKVASSVDNSNQQKSSSTEVPSASNGFLNRLRNLPEISIVFPENNTNDLETSRKDGTKPTSASTSGNDSAISSYSSKNDSSCNPATVTSSQQNVVDKSISTERTESKNKQEKTSKLKKISEPQVPIILNIPSTASTSRIQDIDNMSTRKSSLENQKTAIYKNNGLEISLYEPTSNDSAPFRSRNANQSNTNISESKQNVTTSTSRIQNMTNTQKLASKFPNQTSNTSRIENFSKKTNIDERASIDSSSRIQRNTSGSVENLSRSTSGTSMLNSTSTSNSKNQKSNGAQINDNPPLILNQYVSSMFSNQNRRIGNNRKVQDTSNSRTVSSNRKMISSLDGLKLKIQRVVEPNDSRFLNQNDSVSSQPQNVTSSSRNKNSNQRTCDISTKSKQPPAGNQNQHLASNSDKQKRRTYQRKSRIPENLNDSNQFNRTGMNADISTLGTESGLLSSISRNEGFSEPCNKNSNSPNSRTENKTVPNGCRKTEKLKIQQNPDVLKSGADSRLSSSSRNDLSQTRNQNFGQISENDRQLPFKNQNIPKSSSSRTVPDVSQKTRTSRNHQNENVLLNSVKSNSKSKQQNDSSIADSTSSQPPEVVDLTTNDVPSSDKQNTTVIDLTDDSSRIVPDVDLTHDYQQDRWTYSKKQNSSASRFRHPIVNESVNSKIDALLEPFKNGVSEKSKTPENSGKGPRRSSRGNARFTSWKRGRDETPEVGRTEGPWKGWAYSYCEHYYTPYNFWVQQCRPKNSNRNFTL